MAAGEEVLSIQGMKERFLDVPNRGVSLPPEIDLTKGGDFTRPEVQTELPQSIADMKERFLSSDLANAQQMTTAIRQGQTNQPAGVGFTPDITDPTIQGAVESPSTIADKATRVGLGKDVAAIGRFGLEVGGGLSGVGIARRAVPKLAGKKAMRAAEASGQAIGEAVGSLFAQPFDPMENPLSHARNVAAFGFLGDMGAASLVSRFDKIRKGGTRLSPGARDTIRLLPRDKSPSAGRLSESAFVDLGENIIDNSFTTAGIVGQRNLASATESRSMIDRFIGRFLKGASRTEIDKLVKDVVGERRASFEAIGEKLYGKVDEVAPNGVSTEGLISIRNKLVREAQLDPVQSGSVDQLVQGIDRILGVAPAQRGTKAGFKITSTPTRRLMRKGDPGFDQTFKSTDFILEPGARQRITFEEMSRIRSQAIRLEPDLGDVARTDLSGATKRIVEASDGAMATSALELGDEVYETWRAANRFYKEGIEAFNAPAMKRLAIEEPDLVFKNLFQDDVPERIRNFRKLVLGGTGDVLDNAKSIRKKAKRTLANPNASEMSKFIAAQRLKDVDAGELAWDKFVGQFMQNIVNGSDFGQGLTTLGAKSKRVLKGSTALDRLSQVGDDTLREIFPKRTKRRLFERYLRITEMAQAGTGLNVGSFAVQMVQAGAFFQLLTEGVTGRTIAILAAPAVAANLVKSDDFIRWMTVGSKAKPTSRQGQIAFRKMALIARKLGADIIGPDGERLNEASTKESRDLNDFLASERARRTRRTQ